MGPLFVRAFVLSLSLLFLQSCGGTRSGPALQPTPVPAGQPSKPSEPPKNIVVLGESISDGTGAVSSYELDTDSGAMRRLDRVGLPNLFDVLTVPASRRVIVRVRTGLAIPFMVADVDANGRFSPFVSLSDIQIPQENWISEPIGVVDPNGRFFIVIDPANDIHVFDLKAVAPLPQLYSRHLDEPANFNGPFLAPFGFALDGNSVVVRASTPGAYGSAWFFILPIADDGILGNRIDLSFGHADIAAVANDRLLIRNFSGDANFDAHLQSIELMSVSATGSTASLAKCSTPECLALDYLYVSADARFALGWGNASQQLYRLDLSPAGGLNALPSGTTMSGTSWFTLTANGELAFASDWQRGLLYVYALQSSGDLKQLGVLSGGFFWARLLGA